ncbi:MAG TPA: PRC-barrel domain-containing protein [Acetobacteraceae bacterium]|nr:PRC-barrel domain-containing protein [Acetobacteraceae bacterium]
MKARLLATAALAAVAFALPAGAQGTAPATPAPSATAPAPSTTPPATAPATRPATPQAQTTPGNTMVAPPAGTGAQTTRPAKPGSPAAGASPGAAGAAGVAAGMPLTRVQSLVGQNVVGANNQNAGEVEDLLIDRNGQVRAVVIEWGGVFGIGARRAAVPIESLQFGGPNDRVRLNMTREQLEALPRYDRSAIDNYARERGWGDGVRTYRTN